MDESDPSRRIAPDFFFHQQIYRANGETVPLAPGEYMVEVTRGPEYVPLLKKITVPEGAKSHRESMRLVRWIHPRERGWLTVQVARPERVHLVAAPSEAHEAHRRIASLDELAACLDQLQSAGGRKPAPASRRRPGALAVAR